MGLTNSSRFFATKLSDLSGIEKDFTKHFEGMGYTVATEKTITGIVFSITKGGMFQTVVGLKTALNIDVKQMDGGLQVSMQVGAFGNQLLPTAITFLVAWPVVVPQIIGLVQQNKLDTEAYSVIEQAIRKYESNSASLEGQFCTFCGAPLEEGSVFCPTCGERVDEKNVCPSCGAVITAGSAFCNKCGAKLS